MNVKVSGILLGSVCASPEVLVLSSSPPSKQTYSTAYTLNIDNLGLPNTEMTTKSSIYLPSASRCFKYSSNEGAAEMDLRGSSSSLGAGSRVSAIPPAPMCWPIAVDRVH